MFLFFQVDVLQWWKTHQPEMPLLAALAREVYATPMSSSASERVFSGAGNIVTNTRHNLEPSRVEMLAFIHQNYDRVTIKKWNTFSVAEVNEILAAEKAAEAAKKEKEDKLMPPPTPTKGDSDSDFEPVEKDKGKDKDKDPEAITVAQVEPQPKTPSEKRPIPEKEKSQEYGKSGKSVSAKKKKLDMGAGPSGTSKPKKPKRASMKDLFGEVVYDSESD
jgi:hAT family C-terminal dimerisation region